MSAPTVAPAVVCRAVDDADLAFTTALHHACRRPELAAAGLDDGIVQLLLDQQLHARDASYRTRHGLDDRIIETVTDGTVVPVGRLTVDDGPQGLRVVDLAVLPAWRGQGVATAALASTIARYAGRAVSLRVRHGNPALRLYERLGFVVVDSDELDLHLELTA